MFLDDTIVAIASPPGRRAARGIIRLSGPDAHDILAGISSNTHAQATAATTRVRSVTSARITTARDSTYDIPCLVTWYVAPHTYTGQHAAELLLPGNPDLLQQITSALIAAGARQAEPGEFTARAFLNGKLSLTQAEGVAATIAAETDAQLRAARMLRHGRLATAAEQLAEQIAHCLALLEAGIDFSDQEDVIAIAHPDLHARITRVYDSITQLLDRAVPAEKLAATPSVVLAGPPNAGKSTLFNTLLGRRRAVVSDLAGTTRDVLTETLHLDPFNPFSPEIALSDVAGIDPHSTAGLNPAMQQSGLHALRSADLIVHLQPADRPADEPKPCHGHAWQHELANLLQSDDPRILTVQSKADLCPAPPEATGYGPLRISVHDPASLAFLRAAIADRVTTLATTISSDILVLQPRHEQALQSARQLLCSLVQMTSVHSDGQHMVPDDELVAADLRAALDAIGQLTDRIRPDDLLGRIFSQFCIGK